MNRKKLILLIKTLGLILLFYILSFANINGVIYPFAFGMMFALVWADQKIYLVMPAYLLGSMAAAFNLYTLISCSCTVLVLLVPYLVHLKIKQNIREWELGFYALLSQAGYLYVTLSGGGNPVYATITVIFGVLFMYSSMRVFEAIIIRGFTYKLTDLEILFAGIILLGLTSGLMHFSFYNFEVLKLIAVFLILIAAYSTNYTITFLLAGVMGLGTVISTNNAVLFAPFVIWSLAACAFKIKNKLLPAAAVILAEATVGWYFGLYYSYGIVEFLPTLIAAAGFIVMPETLLDKAAALFISSKDRLAMKDIVNRNREMLSRRLGELGEVFGEMNTIFRSLIKKELSGEEINEMLYEELRDKVCTGCIEKNKCHRSFLEETRKTFNGLLEIALSRGRVTLLDIPSFLTSRCSRLNPLVSAINTLTAQYKKYNSMVGSIDKSKLLVADNLGGISTIMKNLSKEVKKNISFDTVRESKIMDELTYHNIICADAIVYERDEKTVSAGLVVRAEDSSRLRIPEIVSRVCACKMSVNEITQAGRAGFVNINLKTAARYDCIFGSAARTKSASAVSGDCFSVLRLDGDKFMIALCDGMGSGDKAAGASQMAIGLIENFYRAGFDSDLILASVNKLLGLSADDIFSALDICVVDLSSGVADAIKMGAPSGFLKRESGTSVLECGALPLGIISGASPLIYKVVLSDGDMIILCTDGINDSFGDDEDIKDFISDIRSSNPQTVADEILARALANSNGAAMDDMTVLALRIFEK